MKTQSGERAGRMTSAFDEAAIGMAIVSREGRWLEVNRALCAMLGYDARLLLARTFQELTHPDDLESDLAQLQRVLQGEQDSYRIQKRYLHRGGHVVWGLLNVAAVRDAAGEVRHFLAQIQDITTLKETEAKLLRRERFHEQLLALMEASLMGDVGPDFYQRILDTALQVIRGAQVGSVLLRDEAGCYRFVAATGYDLKRLQQTYLHASELFQQHGRMGAQVIYEFDNSMVPEERLTPILDAGPSHLIQEVLAIPVYLAGDPLAFVYLDNLEQGVTFSEDALHMAQLFGQQVAAVWQRLKLEDDLREQRRAFEHLALHDSLTGLPNRSLLEDRLERALSRLDREQRAVALLFADLDDFKRVNDTHGHKTGDALLKGVAERLASSVRLSDTVARWGGDEFVLLVSLASPQDAPAVAERVLAAFATPVRVGGLEFRVRLSLGLALAPAHASDAQTLLQRADEALYSAKASGKHAVVVFSPSP